MGGLSTFCRAGYRKLIVLFVSGLFVSLSPHPAQAIPRPECVVLDSDVDLDDIRAIAVLAGSKHIVAIVTTEGISRANEGAAALQSFLQRIGMNIPIIPGEQPNQHRGYIADPNLPTWRHTAETLNGTIPLGAERFAGASTGLHSNDEGTIVDKLWAVLEHCNRVELLIIGPWTSFMRYGPELLDRIDLIIAQGRPDPDELEGQPNGFNCRYDLNSCLSAYDLLVGRRQRKDRHLRANWVDIPQSPFPLGFADPGVDDKGKPANPYSPTREWAHDLQKGGKAAQAVSDILLKNPDSWEGSGDRRGTSLWDDLVALYLLRPELFGNRGGHWEPLVKAIVVRQILSDYMPN